MKASVTLRAIRIDALRLIDEYVAKTSKKQLTNSQVNRYKHDRLYDIGW